ncbi:hypothetical protein HB662_13045 [Roseomonas frigidaquae]|uniref:Uncharacterized protein n=1 Tax=Falsiroseomonas frigidaquae TaxID=487318 RepID=A0ABX1F053_9PROT|nr:hypothetical protein [Falsiroseomonas frigidaquae]NKE45710.1 hypothetical protein [Falsiroseomonas frigidaquae]
MPENLPFLPVDPAADGRPGSCTGTTLGFSAASAAQAVASALAQFATDHPATSHKVLRSGVLPVTPNEVGQYFAEVAPV